MLAHWGLFSATRGRAPGRQERRARDGVAGRGQGGGRGRGDFEIGWMPRAHKQVAGRRDDARRRPA